MRRTNTSAYILGQETSGLANVVVADTSLPLKRYTARTFKDEGKKVRGSNRSMPTPFVTAAIDTSHHTLASISIGRWNVKVKILWIDLSFSLTPIKNGTVN